MGPAVGDGQGSAGHEVVLDVDDEECVGGPEIHGVYRCYCKPVVLRTMPTLAAIKLRRRWGTRQRFCPQACCGDDTVSCYADEFFGVIWLTN